MCDACRSREAPPVTVSRARALDVPAIHPLLRLQRAAGNRAAAQVLARDDVRRPSWYLPGSPTVDIAGQGMQQAFTSGVRHLSQREKAVAKPVFGESVDLDRVRIATTSVLAAPTTLANTIRTRTGDISNRVLVHELMHVWQYQTSGLRYVSCALAGQAEGSIAHGDRDWTYEYDATRRGTRLADYGPEQQAYIVENAYAQGKLEDAEFYGPLVAEVRKARPRPDDPGFAIDEAAGMTGPRRIDPLGPTAPDWRSEEMGGAVPQLQWRF